MSYKHFLSLALILSVFTVSLPQLGYAQTAAAPAAQAVSDLQSRLSAIEEKVEKRRKELGIPGMSLAIVKDDQVIYAKGLGYRDLEKQIAATADTQFAIGSATKAFTALTALMSADEGKLSLDDSPKKYLPYFKINNPDTDARITVRDLMCHSSGLNRTDLAMITGKLSRAELIKVAGEAKTVAGLREKFMYQNIMFTAAGEIVSTVQKEPWEKFVPERIFAPLGMTNSTMSMKQMEKTKDFSYGYDYNFDTKETRRLPFRDIDEVAPAGAINSSARDMAQWLRFVLNGGTAGGKRLVSEKGFDEWTKQQMKVTPTGSLSYGLGWFLQEWNKLKVLQHGGNIDGFNSMVAMIPEKKIGFVMLTNVSGSTLGGELMPIIWQGLLGENSPAESVRLPVKTMEKMAGKYRLEAAKMDIEVKIDNENLVMVVPGQPTYTLQRTGPRQFKMIGAPDGFAVKFTPEQGDATEMYLQQPQGNYTLPRVNADGTIAKPAVIANAPNPAKEVIGKYEMANKYLTVEVREADGKVFLYVPAQQPYELKEISKDVYSTPPLPDSYSLKIKRNAAGKIDGITLAEPGGEVSFNRVEGESANVPKPSVDEIMAKTIAAMGGEAALRKISSREIKFEVDFEQQGVKGYGISYTKAPNMAATETTLTALGKPIANIFEYFDGAGGGETVSFAPEETYSGKRLEDIKFQNDFYGLLDWKTGLKSAEVTGTEKVNGEEVYVVVLRPEKASECTYYISAKSFLPLKRTSVIVSSTSEAKLPTSDVYSDYRSVDGAMIPFKVTSASPSMGDVVTYVKEVKSNVEIKDSEFKHKK
jgi:CubicO group peptidase (beta-lactamase class C family)